MQENATKETILTNDVTIIGVISSDFTFSHEHLGEKFYKGFVSAKRLSGVIDQIPVFIPEKFYCMLQESYQGKHVKVTGCFRSYNKWDENSQRNRLILTVFAQTMEFLENTGEGIDRNMITLEGTICKMPTSRTTPLSHKKITDLLLAVNRPYNHSDYIPCICWGYYAQVASELPVGSYISLNGFIQSREYTKQLTETESEKRIAYEVSVYQLDVISVPKI